MKFKKAKFYTVLSMVIVISGLFIFSPLIPLGGGSNADSEIIVPEVPDEDNGDDNSQGDTIYKFTNAQAAVNQAYENLQTKGFYSVIEANLYAIGAIFTFNLNGQRYYDEKENVKACQMIIKSSKDTPIVTADVDYRFRITPELIGATDYHLLFDKSKYYCYKYKYQDVNSYLQDFKMMPDAPIAIFNPSTVSGNSSIYRYPKYYKINSCLEPSSLGDFVPFLSGLFSNFVALTVIPDKVNITMNIKSNGDLEKVNFNTNCTFQIDCREYGLGIIKFTGKFEFTEHYYSASYIKPFDLNPEFYA